MKKKLSEAVVDSVEGQAKSVQLFIFSVYKHFLLIVKRF